MITLRNPILTNPAYKRVERQESHTYGVFLFLRIFVCKENESCGQTIEKKRWVEIFHDSEDIFT